MFRVLKTAHPYRVGNQNVVQRALHAVEEDLAILAILRVAQLGSRIVEALIGPAVVGSKTGKVFVHFLLSSTKK